MKYLLCFFLLFCSCSSFEKHPTLKVGATAVPHAEILEQVKPSLAAQGIDLEIVILNDYNLPNRLLAEKELDANYFQHLPFLKEQVKQFHYPISCLVKVHLEPMGLYSKSVEAIADLKKGSKIAIPSDPSNEGRALLLLHDHHLITLKDPSNLFSTVLDIVDNPSALHFVEVDAALLPRTLQDVDAAVINTNFALQAGLNPLKQALLLESANSPYVNIVATLNSEKENPKLQALKEAMNSEQIKAFILEKYQGAIIPAFGACP